MMMRTKAYLILLVLTIITGCTTVYRTVESPDFHALYGNSQPKQRFLTASEAHENAGNISYQKDVKPILDARCVACHACYDAPCQLKLGSSTGLDRGATKQVVYDGGRLKPVDPTRLFIDALNTAEWRDKSFYPVLNERQDSTQAALNNSLLAKLIRQKRDNPLPESGKLSDDYLLDRDRSLECPSVDEYAEYRQKHPQWGMPYALPGLTLKQEYTLLSWLQEGAKFDALAEISTAAMQEIAAWEAFFNRPTLKQQLVSRYIYEHLFLGHIYFKGQSQNEFFRLVRSSTPSGQPVREITTSLPYEDPGVSRFYYRLRLVEETIVDKTHFVYAFSAAKKARYEELFFQPDYAVTQLPSYDSYVAANPFKAFVDIPATSRYQFMLDDAQYFVSGFIKGPVCRGQIALGVIRDRFWVAFLNPGGAKNQPEKVKKMHDFLAKQETVLSLPGTAGDALGLFGYQEYDGLAREYLEHKEAFANRVIAEFGGFSIADLWNGNDGTNPNAALTVFRHFDAATVEQGFIGDIPLTAWIVDYPLFERIHYLLVAGFDVYSAIGHQLASRTYMDFLRMDGENNFLRLMPVSQRIAMHESWYKGVTGSLIEFLNTSYYSMGYETGISYQTTEYKKEFFDQLRQHLGVAAGVKEVINSCEQEACVSRKQTATVDELMKELAQLKGSKLDIFPEVSFLRVTNAQGKDDLVYTLLVNKAFANVALLISEDFRREPKLDTLTVVPGFVGSYPNFYFVLEESRLADFIVAIKGAKTKAEKEGFYSQYGIRRSNPDFWPQTDWFNAQHKKYRGEQAGLFDLNRYENR